MKDWTVFIARRFLLRRQKRGEGFIMALPVFGIALGIITLVTVIGIMNGFQLGFIENILEVYSYHLQIESHDSHSDLDIKTINGNPQVEAAVLFRESFSLLNSETSKMKGATVRGIHSGQAMSDPSFTRQLSMTSGAFAGDTAGEIVIGSHMARNLGIYTGDTIQITGTGLSKNASIVMPITQVLTVSGIFETGYYLYDSTLVFVSLETYDQLFPNQGEVTIGVKLSSHDIVDHVAALWKRDNPDFSIKTWKEINRSFFSALAVEKSLMGFVVSLIFLVVSINLHHSIRRSILERRQDIGTLKALGAKTFSLQKIILFEGSIIGILGTLTGAPASLLVAGNVNGILRGLEDILLMCAALGNALIPGIADNVSLFFFSAYPVRILPCEYVISICFGLVAPVIGAYIASRDILSLYPVEVLHYE